MSQILLSVKVEASEYAVMLIKASQKYFQELDSNTSILYLSLLLDIT